MSKIKEIEFVCFFQKNGKENKKKTGLSMWLTCQPNPIVVLTSWVLFGPLLWIQISLVYIFRIQVGQ